MSKLITLGCSLTHQAGWAQYLSECMNLPLHNLAQSAGSNQIQQKRIQEFIFTNNLSSDDIVIWQLTSTIRYFKREQLNFHNQEKIEYFKKNSNTHPTLIKTNKNLFDNTERVDYLCNSVNHNNESDEAQFLEDMLFYLISIKKFTPNVFVFLGWKEVISAEYHETFEKLLNKFQINYVNESLIEWCSKNKLNFDLSEHPTVGSSSRYARDVLIPNIEKILKVKINAVPLWAE